MEVGKKTAIVLATYNGETWVEEQLRSIAAQAAVEWHVFMRDDGSVDNTTEVAAAFIRKHPNVTCLEPFEGASGSPAGNFLLALRRIHLQEFDYIAFSDQDDIWSPRKLSRAIDCLERGGADAYSCDLMAFDNGRRRAWYLRKSGQQRRFDYLFQGASAGCTYVLTRRAAQLVLERTQSLGADNFRRCSHDWLIYAICRSHGLAWYMDRAAFVFYRQHRDNAYGAAPAVAGLKARLRLARSGWYRAHVMWLRQFLAATAEESRILDAVGALRSKDRLWLACNVGEFRRELHDRLLLVLAILFGGF